MVHRLNRTEYGNAIRDLLALDVDVTELLPSDGANFGFDNIAASLNTSPLLLERYLTAAQRISAQAVGDPDGAPGTTEYSISREFTQSGHIDGLAARDARRHGGPSCVSGRRRIQALRAAGQGSGGRLRRS